MQSDAHIHSMFFAPILDHAHRTMGAERVAEVLAQFGTTEAELRDPRAWFSSELTDSLADGFVEASGNPDFFREVGRLFMTGPYTGSLTPLIRLFGSPRNVFASFPGTAPRWCKSGRYVIHEIDDRSVRLSFESDLERSIQVCIGRESQFRWCFPALFGYAPAEVEHTECMHRGGERCTYQLRWTPPAPSPVRWVAPATGAIIGALLGLVSGLGAGSIALSLVGLAIGVLIALVVRLDDQLTDRSDALLEQAVELRRGREAEERRYAELLEAKRFVDLRVEERTADLKRTAVQLEDALAEVRALDEVKSRFFANVNHELRTPLQLILAPLDDLVEGREPAGGREPALRAMQRNASRLHALINQTLDLARVDAGAETLRRTVHDPVALLRGVADSFVSAATSSGIHLELVTEGLADATMLDGHWIESALTNLVANALRHCDPGDTVTVRGVATSERLRISVEDTGPGIPPEDLPSIFERFAQSKQKETGPRGTGLGLAIVHEAARLHGGTATVQSEVGVGTTFVLDLPRVAPDGSASSAAVDVPATPQSSNRPDDDDTELPEVYELPGPTDHAPLAVVAEDQPDLRRYIATILAGEYRVVACSNGRLALDAVLERLPALVVTDRSMPELTGVELCRALRQRPETETLPVILLTAHRELTDVLSAYEAGADDYVTKPFHAQELLARARTHVGLRELRGQLVFRERLASVGLLAAEIAHHLRNPLNVIQNGLGVIGEELPLARQPLVGVMRDCATRIALVSDDLLHLAEGREERAAEAHHPGQGLRRAVRLVGASTQGLRIEDSVDDAAIVEGVPGELSQVFLYLVEHASRATDHCGTLRVEGLARDGCYVVTVAHSGRRMSEAERARIFEPVRAEERGVGSGLDLSIAAHLVRQHGGTLEVGADDELGGDRFELALPLIGAPAVA